MVRMNLVVNLISNTVSKLLSIIIHTIVVLSSSFVDIGRVESERKLLSLITETASAQWMPIDILPKRGLKTKKSHCLLSSDEVLNLDSKKK